MVLGSPILRTPQMGNCPLPCFMTRRYCHCNQNLKAAANPPIHPTQNIRADMWRGIVFCITSFASEIMDSDHGLCQHDWGVKYLLSCVLFLPPVQKTFQNKLGDDWWTEFPQDIYPTTICYIQLYTSYSWVMTLSTLYLLSTPVISSTSYFNMWVP